ncbi:MAG: electron transfer flavoprotein subunit beta/FixA family protein [Deltaproteobacteria bacterium]|nr:MAG: electron transfer flavoprotein subunit beta/FixA family protein [Deltaproteobacteria bacterium]
MKILVLVKEVMDANAGLAPSPDGSRVLPDGTDPVCRIGPDDRAALEEAVKIRASQGSGSVTAVTVGSTENVNGLRICLARGVDRAVRIVTEDNPYQDAFSTARIIKKAVEKLGFNLILCGNKSYDLGRSQVGAILAELLGIPQVSRVVKIETGNRTRVQVQRRMEKGDREIVECPLPALLTVDHLAGEPQYISVNALLVAENQPVESWDLASLDLTSDKLDQEGSQTRLMAFEPPRPRPKKIFVPDSSLSPDQKINLLLTGGLTQEKKKGSDLLQGSPDHLADEIIKFLKEKGIIPSVSKA